MRNVFFTVYLVLAATMLIAVEVPKDQTLSVKTTQGIKSFTAGTPVTGGQSSWGLIVLTGGEGMRPAIALSSSNPTVASVPAAVTFAAKASDQTFEIKTSPVREPTQVTLSAKTSTAEVKTIITVVPPKLASVGCTLPAEISPGETLSCKVWLDGPAAADIAITPWSANWFLKVVQPSVTIKKGTKNAAFDVLGGAVPEEAQGSLTVVYDGVTKVFPIKVLRRAVERLILQEQTIDGAATTRARVRLTAAAPEGGFAVKLGVEWAPGSGPFSPGPAHIPSKVIVPAGLREVSFDIKSRSIPKTVTVLITASSNFGGEGDSKSEPLTIRAFRLRELKTEGASSFQIPLGGLDVELTLQSMGPAPEEGMRVEVAYGGQPQTTGPSHVTLSGGLTSKRFKVHLPPCPAGGCYASITASNSMNSVTKVLYFYS